MSTQSVFLLSRSARSKGNAINQLADGFRKIVARSKQTNEGTKINAGETRVNRTEAKHTSATRNKSSLDSRYSLPTKKVNGLIRVDCRGNEDLPEVSTSDSSSFFPPFTPWRFSIRTRPHVKISARSVYFRPAVINIRITRS